jgi:PleD family two-component response regulator
MIEANERKVLIVGGSSSEIANLRNELVADGCWVRVSETAEAALAEPGTWKPAIIIADDAFAELITRLRPYAPIYLF